jgi:hypothetical protein
VVEGGASALDLASNPFYRQFTDAIELSPEIGALPAMRGSGAVRDLREAAQLSPELAGQLAELTALSETGNLGRGEYQARIASLIDTWAASADFQTSREAAGSVSEHNDGAMQLHYLPPGVGASEAAAAFAGVSPGAGSEPMTASILFGCTMPTRATGRLHGGARGLLFFPMKHGARLQYGVFAGIEINVEDLGEMP